MFLDANIQSTKLLCSYDSSEELKTVLSKCLGILPEDLNLHFGTTEDVFNDFADFKLSKLPKDNRLDNDMISWRQAVTFAKFGTQNDIDLFMKPLKDIIKEDAKFNETMSLLHFIMGGVAFQIDSERLGIMSESWLSYGSKHLENITISEVLKELNITKNKLLSLPLNVLISSLRVPKNQMIFTPYQFWLNKPCFNDSFKISSIIQQCMLAQDHIISLVGVQSQDFTFLQLNGFVSHIPIQTLNLASMMIYFNVNAKSSFVLLTTTSSIVERVAKPEEVTEYTLSQLASKISFGHISTYIGSLLDLPRNGTKLKDMLNSTDTFFTNIEQLNLLKFSTLYRFRNLQSRAQEATAYHKQLLRLTSQPFILLSHVWS